MIGRVAAFGPNQSSSSITMAALIANKSRRKPLTYGKATRKHAVDSDQASKFSHGQTQSTGLILDGGRTTGLGWGRWETSADENTTYDEEEVINPYTRPSYHATPLRNGVKLPSKTPAPSTVVVAMEVGSAYPSAVRQVTPYDGLDDLAIFEFPSDGHANSKSLLPKASTSRKRKRVNPAADVASASVSDANSLQPHDPLNEGLDQRHVCQARQTEAIASEKPSLGKHTRKTKQTSRTHGDRVHGTTPSRTRRRTAPVTFVSHGGAQSAQRFPSREDSPVHEAQVRCDIPTLGKRNVVPADLRLFNSGIDDSESTNQDYLTLKLSKRPSPLQRIQATKNPPRPDMIDNANVDAHTGTARRTTPPIAASQGHQLNRPPGSDEDAAPQWERDKLDAELTVSFRTPHRSGKIMFQEDIQQVTPVRQGFTKLVHAMKQHHPPPAPQSSKLQWNIENNGQEIDGLDAESSSPAGLTTLEASAASSTQSTDQGHSQEPILVQSQTVASSQDAGPKVTYARERSYLTGNTLEETEGFSMPIDFDSDCRQGRRRRGERSVRPVISPLLVSQEEESGVGGGIRSIHELREAGERHKFVHAIESLLDDLENKESWSLSQKRGTLLSLARKLAVPGCALRFAECGLEQRLFDLGHSENDPVARFLLASAIMFLFCNRSSKSPISRPQYACAKKFMVVLLTAEDDVGTLARDRHNNMSRASRSELLAFRTLVEQSPVWKYKPPLTISSQLIALTVLETMIHKLREAGDGSEFLSGNVLEQLVEISLLQRSKSGSSRNLECDDVTGMLALSILDACTMAGPSGTDDNLWSPEFFARVANLLRPTSGSFGGEAAESRNLVLRLYLNLTNNDPSLCETFSKSKTIVAIFDIVDSHFHALSQGTAGDNRTLLLDNLILSLGCLINLVECSDAARVAVLTAKSDSASILQRLLQIFLDRVELAPKASGHLPHTGAAIDYTRWIRSKAASATYLLGIYRCF